MKKGKKKSSSTNVSSTANKRKRKGKEKKQSKKTKKNMVQDNTAQNNDVGAHDSFIDYLNYNLNRSSMAEESLLLSPIIGDASRRSNVSVKSFQSSMAASDRMSSVTKRTRSSRRYSSSSSATLVEKEEIISNHSHMDHPPKSMNQMLDTSACVSLGLGSSLEDISQSDSDIPEWNHDIGQPENGDKKSPNDAEDNNSFQDTSGLSLDDSNVTEVSTDEMKAGHFSQRTQHTLVVRKYKQKVVSSHNSDDEENTDPSYQDENKSSVPPASFLSPSSSTQRSKNSTPKSGDKSVRFTPDTKDSCSSKHADENMVDRQNLYSHSPAKINITDRISNGLTPRLKALKEKIHRDSGIMVEQNQSDIYVEAQVTRYNTTSFNIDSPTNHLLERKLMDQELQYTKESTTPEAYKVDNRLSLTPFLRAAKEKLKQDSDDDYMVMPKTEAPLEYYMSAHQSSSNIESSWGSFTPLSQGKSKRETINRLSFVTVGEEDTSVDQPKDLSSAKKNLNAQSSAVLLKMKGAAQKRMQLLAKSRDSLAAKETMHVTRTATLPVVMEESNATKRVEINGVPREKVMHETNDNKFQAKPMPKYSKSGATGIPVVEKRPVTKPISPKLGLRLPLRQKGDGVHSEDDVTFKAKGLPKSILKPSKLPDVQRRPLTVAKSPLLGARRTDMEKPKSLQRPSSVPRNYKSSSHNPLHNHNDSPVGLGFLGNSVSMDENTPPNKMGTLILHSTIRAEKRHAFDILRTAHEEERRLELKRDRDRMLKAKYRELDGLKEALR